jgi:molybdenum cofactor guanylyltransferase
LKPVYPVRAFVLAGGASTRFGSDKARYKINGLAMVVRVAKAFESAGFQVSIIARDNRLLDCGFPLLVESETGPLHPLAGVIAGLESLEAGESALFAPCDVPFLSTVDINALATSAAPAIAVSIDSEKTHPLIAHYNKRLLTLARAILAAEGPVRDFASEAALVPMSEVSLSNLNYKN